MLSVAAGSMDIIGFLRLGGLFTPTSLAMWWFSPPSLSLAKRRRWPI